MGLFMTSLSGEQGTSPGAAVSIFQQQKIGQVPDRNLAL